MIALQKILLRRWESKENEKFHSNEEKILFAKHVPGKLFAYRIYNEL